MNVPSDLEVALRALVEAQRAALAYVAPWRLPDLGDVVRAEADVLLAEIRSDKQAQ